MAVTLFNMPVMTLAEYMDATGIKDRSLAELVGVSRPMITRLKLGTAKPSLKTLLAIERVTRGKVRASDFGEAA